MGKKIYDWPVIAIDYNAGMSWDDLGAKYGCSHEGIQKALATGRLIQRSRIKPKRRPRKIKTKEQNSEYCRNHYQKNKARYKSKARANSLVRAEKSRAIILERFAHGCVDCGETDLLVLEFDHRDRVDKEYQISFLCNPRGANVKKLETELKKCDVRCANCHRRKTAVECGSWRTKLALGTGVEPVIPSPQPGGLPLA